MQHALKLLAQAWHLSPAHYWHLRLLSALLLGPLLGVLAVVVSSLLGHSRANKLRLPH